MKPNCNLKSLLPIMFHDILISLTVLMYPCNVWINFVVNFSQKSAVQISVESFYCHFYLVTWAKPS